MTKLISAATITDITGAATFHGQAGVPPAPPRDTLIAELRKSHGNEKIDKIINNIPAGFDLVPVFYSRIDQTDNKRIMAEFTFFIRPRFLQFLGKQHADSLRAFGICEHGIERMTRGLDPATKDGVIYELSVDHIIERSGSGAWGTTQAVDQQSRNPHRNYMPNHFDNLILLPDAIHQYKNELNTLQNGTGGDGKSRWILMLTPVVDATSCGYVCAPQPAGSKWHNMKFRPNNIQTRLSQASYSLPIAKEAMKHFSNIPEAAAFLKTAKDYAAAQKLTPLEIANDNNVIQGKSLRKVFAEACVKNPEVGFAKDRAINAVNDVEYNLRKTYEMAASRMKNHRSTQEFYQLEEFFNIYAIYNLRKTIQDYPCPEALTTHLAFQKLEKDIQNLRVQAQSTKYKNPRR